MILAGRTGRNGWRIASVASRLAGRRSIERNLFGVEVGRIAPGLWADFAAIDLGSPLLAGWMPETLLESVIFGATEGVVAATCAGGIGGASGRG